MPPGWREGCMEGGQRVMRTHSPLLGHMSTSEHPSFKGTSGSCTWTKAQCWADLWSRHWGDSTRCVGVVPLLPTWAASAGLCGVSVGSLWGFWEAPHFPSQLNCHPGDALGGSLKQNSQSLIRVLVRNQILGPTPIPPQT